MNKMAQHYYAIGDEMPVDVDITAGVQKTLLMIGESEETEMPEYLITKREKCSHPESSFVPTDIPCPEGRGFSCGVAHFTSACPICGPKGYIDTLVPLADALHDLGVDLEQMQVDQMATATPVWPICDGQHDWQTFQGGPIVGAATVCMKCGRLRSDIAHIDTALDTVDSDVELLPPPQ